MNAFLALILAVFTFTALPITAFAQNEALTEGKIKTYLKQENQILKGNAGKFSPSEVQNYLEKHLAPDFSYQDTVTTNLGPFGSGSETLRYDRQQYINDILANIHSVGEVDSNIDIQDIQIGSNGQKARVTYRTEAEMSAQNDQLSALSQSGRDISFGIDATSDCVSILNWSETFSVVQTQQLICSTNARMNIPSEFNPFQN